MASSLLLAGRYRIEREIGAGGIGVVYLAFDANTGARVAIKLLYPEFARIPDYVARFHRGAQIAQDLNSPYIVPVLDHGNDGNEHFLVMEYVDGQSLFDVLQVRRKLTAREARTIIKHVALALEAAHKRNVVHRDISPGNILLAKDGTAKVSDFDIAHSIDSTRMTSTGLFMGKVQYSAPETLRGQSDIRSDIYALGVVTYEMVLGRPPFEATNVLEAIDLHEHAEPPGLDQLVRKDATLGAIVARCLAKRADERYQEPRDLLLALDGHVVPAPPASTVQQASAPIDRSATLRMEPGSRRRDAPWPATRARSASGRLLLLGIASVALAGVAGIVFLAVARTADSARQDTRSEGNEPTVAAGAPSSAAGLQDTGCDLSGSTLLAGFPLPGGAQCDQSVAYAPGSYPETNKNCVVENWDAYSRANWETASLRVGQPLASVAIFYDELRVGDRFLGFTDGDTASYAWGVGQTGMEVQARAGADPGATDLHIAACTPAPLPTPDTQVLRAAFGEMPLPEGAQLTSTTNEGSCFAGGYDLLDKRVYETFIPQDLLTSLAQRLPSWTMEPESSTAASFNKDNLLLKIILDPASAKLVVYRCFQQQEP